MADVPRGTRCSRGRTSLRQYAARSPSTAAPDVDEGPSRCAAWRARSAVEQLILSSQLFHVEQPKRSPHPPRRGGGRRLRRGPHLLRRGRSQGLATLAPASRPHLCQPQSDSCLYDSRWCEQCQDSMPAHTGVHRRATAALRTPHIGWIRAAGRRHLYARTCPSRGCRTFPRPVGPRLRADPVSPVRLAIRDRCTVKPSVRAAGPTRRGETRSVDCRNCPAGRPARCPFAVRFARRRARREGRLSLW